MRAIFTAIALLAVGVLADLTINTPGNVVECQPTLLSWTGGTAPYYLIWNSILPGASPNGAALESFPAMNGTSYTWTVNIAQGTSIGFTLRDSTGTVAQSAPVTVQPGTSDCLGSSSAITGASASPSTSTASAASAGSSASTTVAGASTSSSSTKAATSAASASSTGTSSTGGASANAVQFGAAGLVGVAVAAILL